MCKNIINKLSDPAYNARIINLSTIMLGMVMYLVSACSCNDGRIKEGKQIKTGSSIKNRTLINKGRSLILDGDLLTRSDNDFESLSLQNFSKKDRTYSHSGIAFMEDSIWFVYHSIAGGENPGANIKKEPFDSFVNPIKKTGFGIFRYQLSAAEINNMHALYKKYYAEKMPFDKSFNLKTDDSMYCSEIIYKSLKLVTNNRVVLPISTLTNFKPKTTSVHFKNVFFKKFDYVGLDDLYINSFCKKIFSAQFN